MLCAESTLAGTGGEAVYQKFLWFRLGSGFVYGKKKWVHGNHRDRRPSCDRSVLVILIEKVGKLADYLERSHYISVAFWLTGGSLFLLFDCTRRG